MVLCYCSAQVVLLAATSAQPMLCLFSVSSLVRPFYIDEVIKDI